MFLLLALAVSAGSASAQCDISGNINAARNSDPNGPAWVYTMTVTWDNDVKYALSHFDLLIDGVSGACSLADLVGVLSWDDPIGTSDGEGGCTVSYYGDLSDIGDPSIPGVTGLLLKFEPYPGCEPGNTGTGVFVFYSDLAPVPVDEDILSMVDKYALMYCFGHLSGMFPGLDCNPVADEAVSFGAVKGLYR
ncbi:hypothetical protein COW53_04215 [bacterium CG17_big_fil_post_rev_8_21_14_2_50_64_8]|nr:MAG: hypothetical protein COW53_04215 [bacterium CG17_big_fil_post_rev_8_21_14_2_50_64_8]PJA73362.1 MAG: hypothetical protein CO151_13435 [bacterium CG_4_9_14_3_um_filter_65_15]